MKKILYLSISNGEDQFYKDQRNMHPLVENFNLIDTIWLYNKIFLGIGYYFCPRFLYFLYGSWKKSIDNYEIIIIDSRRASKYAVIWIKKKYPNKRVIVWYWNQVSKAELSPDFCKKNGCEVWSFDKEDCRKFDMHFNEQYYFYYYDETKTDNCYDIYYLGIYTEEREKQINDLEQNFCDNKIIFRYKLVHHSKERVNYKNYIAQMKRSKAILELNKKGQSGITLRALEALFYQKKLITNNKSIINEAFYNKKNIFIIDEDKYSELNKFLNEPYMYNDEYYDLLHYYSFDSWIERIVNYEENTNCSIFLSTRK